MHFDADLVINRGDDRIAVGSDDGALVVVSDQFRPLLRDLRSDGLVHGGSLRKLSGALDAAGATVRFETTSGPLVTIGASPQGPQPLMRLVRLPNLRVESVRGVAATFRPRTDATSAAIAAGALIVLAVRRVRAGRLSSAGCRR